MIMARWKVINGIPSNSGLKIGVFLNLTIENTVNFMKLPSTLAHLWWRFPKASVKLYEASVQEWDWKASRARLKMNDLEQAKKVPRCPKWRDENNLNSWVAEGFWGWDRRILTGWILDLFQPFHFQDWML